MLVRKNESFPLRPIIICLYGTPGAGKTSLFNTSENPLLIDCDRGADRALNRAEATIVAHDWAEVLKYETDIKDFKTVGIDTAKAVLDDFLMVHVVNNDYKLKTNKLKAYGAIGDEFKMFINRRRGEGIDIVIIAHAKEEKDGDNLRLSPDVTGQSKDLILRIADQVGFITIENNKRVITFEPTDKTIGKNVARIPKTEIPDESDPKYKTFLSDIIATVKQSIQKQSAEQVEAMNQIEDFQKRLVGCKDNESLMAISKECATLPKAQQAAMRKRVTDHIASIGMFFDKVNNCFVAKEQPKENAEFELTSEPV